MNIAAAIIFENIVAALCVEQIISEKSDRLWFGAKAPSELANVICVFRQAQFLRQRRCLLTSSVAAICSSNTFYASNRIVAEHRGGELCMK